MTEEHVPDLVSATFEWYLNPPQTSGTLSERRARAWLSTTPAYVTSARVGYPNTRPAAIIEAALEVVSTERLPEWRTHDEAVADLTRLLEHAYARLQKDDR